MKPVPALATLYANLARDAEVVAAREKKYAMQARRERKFAGLDAEIARRKRQGSRLADDKLEYQICMEFYKYRLEVSRHYTKIAKRYRSLERKARGTR